MMMMWFASEPAVGQRCSTCSSGPGTRSAGCSPSPEPSCVQRRSRLAPRGPANHMRWGPRRCTRVRAPQACHHARGGPASWPTLSDKPCAAARPCTRPEPPKALSSPTSSPFGSRARTRCAGVPLAPGSLAPPLQLRPQHLRPRRHRRGLAPTRRRTMSVDVPFPSPRVCHLGPGPARRPRRRRLPSAGPLHRQGHPGSLRLARRRPVRAVLRRHRVGLRRGCRVGTMRPLVRDDFPPEFPHRETWRRLFPPFSPTTLDTLRPTATQRKEGGAGTKAQVQGPSLEKSVHTGT